MAVVKAARRRGASPLGQAINDFNDYGAKIDSIFMEGEKLVLKCEFPSKVTSNRVWTVIKQCDPNYPDFIIQMTVTGGESRPYTIKSGDTLSAVCMKFYGHANKCPQVA